MKNLIQTSLWLLGALTISTIVSCKQLMIEKQELIAQQEQEDATQKEAALEEQQDIVPQEAIPWPIPSAKVKQFIEAIPPGEALLVMIRPEYFQKRGIQFPAVFHEHDGQEFMFALEDVMDDAAKRLQDYYSQCPSNNTMQLVPVADPADLQQIAWKTSPGAAGKKNLNIKRQYLGEGKEGVNEFFRLRDSPYPWIRLCKKAWMHDAVDYIPAQEEKWSCGPNSAAKAIHLFGENISKSTYRSAFRPSAPRKFSKERTRSTGVNVTTTGAVMMIAGGLLAPFTGGGSLALTLGLGGAGLNVVGAGTATVGEYAPSDSGVTPKDLAKHVTRYLPGSKYAKHKSYNDFWECAKDIRADMRRGDPVIVFWTYTATQAHYVNIVGVSVDKKDLPEDFVIMDTDNCLHRYNYKDMRYLMKREFATWAFAAGTDDYHIIRFYR